MILRSLLSLLVAGTAFVQCASAIVIDDFTDGDVLLSPTNLAGDSVDQSDLDPSSVAGGSRSVYAGSLDRGELRIDSAQGNFTFDASSSWGYFTLGYGTQAPLLMDLEASADRFELSFEDVTPGLWRGLYDVRVVTSTGTFRRSFAHKLFELNGPGVVQIPFAEFINADFSEVREIEFQAARIEPGFTIALQSIQVVPEPAGLGVLLAGWLALGVRRRAI